MGGLRWEGCFFLFFLVHEILFILVKVLEGLSWEGWCVRTTLGGLEWEGRGC